VAAGRLRPPPVPYTVLLALSPLVPVAVAGPRAGRSPVLRLGPDSALLPRATWRIRAVVIRPAGRAATRRAGPAGAREAVAASCHRRTATAPGALGASGSAAAVALVVASGALRACSRVGSDIW